jgi:sarcosine oxidase subunit beta
MTTTAEVIIVGGGVIGCSIAFYLAREGARVLLLERQALGTGTTGRSGAIVRQHYSNDFTIRMARESLQVFQHFDEQIGGDCGFTTTGMLVLADEQGAADLQANVALQQREGVHVRLLAPEEIAQVAPGYSAEGVALACYEEEAGVADPLATTSAFARRARDYGAELREGEGVLRILTEGGRVTGVVTTQARLSASCVVLAANVWSRALAEGLGIGLPIRSTRHAMVVVRRPLEVGDRLSWHPVGLDMLRQVYLRPEIGGLTLVGSLSDVHTESEPDSYTQGVGEEEIATLSHLGASTFPALARGVVRGGWAGLYDDTPDYHPILDKLPGYEGLYCAAGFSGHGFKLAPVVGRWMAQLILHGQKAADMQPFSYDRFARGALIQPRYPSGVLA